jgi:hypothetical protein
MKGLREGNFETEQRYKLFSWPLPDFFSDKFLIVILFLNITRFQSWHFTQNNSKQGELMFSEWLGGTVKFILLY